MDSNTASEVKIRAFDKNTVYTEHQDCDNFTGIRLRVGDDAFAGSAALLQKMSLEVLKGNFNLLSVIPPAIC